MQKLMQWTAIIGVLFAAAALSLIFYMGSHKVVVVAEDLESTTAESEQTESATEVIDSNDQNVTFTKQTTQESCIYIPLEVKVKADGISIRNMNLNQKIEVTLKGATTDYYTDHQITGNTALLKDSYCRQDGKNLKLYLDFSGIYEFNSRLTNGYLQINLIEPKQQYAKVIVLDDRADSTDKEEQKILKNIAAKVEEILSAADIKVYDTASDEEYVTDQDVIHMANSLPADMYIGLGLAKSVKDAGTFGTFAVYDPIYFQPGVSNAQAADAMERGVVLAVSGKADGLKECTASSILYQLQVPSTVIYPGYLTSDKEGDLLRQEEYQNLIAEGISKGVQEIYTTMGR